jgi:hypothetical protein
MVSLICCGAQRPAAGLGGEETLDQTLAPGVRCIPLAARVPPGAQD